MRKRLNAYNPGATAKPRLSAEKIAQIKAMIMVGEPPASIVSVVGCSSGIVHYYKTEHLRARAERREPPARNDIGVVRLCFVDECHETVEKGCAYCAAHKGVPGRAAEQTSAFIAALPMSRLMARR